MDEDKFYKIYEEDGKPDRIIAFLLAAGAANGHDYLEDDGFDFDIWLKEWKAGEMKEDDKSVLIRNMADSLKDWRAAD